jgi:hypothetical protein
MAKKEAKDDCKVIVKIVRVADWNPGPLLEAMEELEAKQEVKEGA